MGRLEAWADRDQQVKDSLNEIMNDKAGSVDVYRNRHNSQRVGFDSEVKEPLLLKTILARIDLAKDRTVPNTPQEIAQEAAHIALTDDTDVRFGDIWEFYDLGGQKQRLRVVKAEATQAGTAVGLDALKAARR